MDREKQIEMIRKFGNKNSCYKPFIGGITYPLHSADFVRVGFLQIAPTLSSRDYKDPKIVIVSDKKQKIYGTTHFPHGWLGFNYDFSGICPTLNTLIHQQHTLIIEAINEQKRDC